MPSKTESDNVVIAKFMGLEKYSDTYLYRSPLTNKYTDCRNFKYDTSWDWLMPVVERFFEAMNNIEDKVLGNLKRGIIERAIWDALYKRKTIADVAKILADEIRWYNSQSPDTIK